MYSFGNQPYSSVNSILFPYQVPTCQNCNYVTSFMPGYYPHTIPHTWEQYRQQGVVLPPVQTAPLMSSANLTTDLINDARTITDILAFNQNLVFQLIDAAQKSQTDKVNDIIKNFPVKNRLRVTYTPGIIKLRLLPLDPKNTCCSIEMSLNWGAPF